MCLRITWLLYVRTSPYIGKETQTCDLSVLTRHAPMIVRGVTDFLSLLLHVPNDRVERFISEPVNDGHGLKNDHT